MSVFNLAWNYQICDRWPKNVVFENKLFLKPKRMFIQIKINILRRPYTLKQPVAWFANTCTYIEYGKLNRNSDLYLYCSSMWRFLYQQRFERRIKLNDSDNFFYRKVKYFKWIKLPKRQVNEIYKIQWNRSAFSNVIWNLDESQISPRRLRIWIMAIKETIALIAHCSIQSRSN